MNGHNGESFVISRELSSSVFDRAKILVIVSKQLVNKISQAHRFKLKSTSTLPSHASNESFLVNKTRRESQPERRKGGRITFIAFALSRASESYSKRNADSKADIS